FKNADAGKQLALNQNMNGSDIIYALAGDADSGVLAASKEAKFLLIGSGSDPDFSEANRVLTNTRKLYNVVVFQTVKDTLQGRFPSGKVFYDLKNGGVDLSPLNKNVPEYISNRLDQIRDDIMNGWIRVGVEIPEWAKRQNQK
ncbi:MAG: BMP family ABC transporter substrate-binding protein, partial [SAR324 cluster bacterium]|nr:BMP family ABC transporter substrate-binding protein [SAR324 cluster bacterium]